MQIEATCEALPIVMAPEETQDWRTIDFSQDTTTDGIGDTVWRFFSTSTAPRTLSIDSAEYNGGAQKIVKNNSNTHDLTVNFITGSDRFVLADNSQVASITVRPGEAYTMSRNSGTFWNVTAVYSRNTPAEIFTRLSGWQRVNNAAIVRQGEIDGIPTAILTDFSGSTSHYRTTELLPKTLSQNACIQFVRIDGVSWMLRTAGAGTQELIVNSDSGNVFADNSGAGVDPIIGPVTMTDDLIEVNATFLPNTGITQWDLFAAVGPDDIVDGTGFDGAAQGTLEIVKLNLNATLPTSSGVAIQLTDGDLLDFTTSGTNTLITDQSATLTAEQLRVVSSKTYTIGTQRELTLVVEAFEDDAFELTLGSSYIGSNGRVVNASANHIDDTIEDNAAHKPSVYVTSPGTLTINRDDSEQNGVSTIAIRVTIEDAVPEPLFIEPTMATVIPATNFTPELTAETTAPTLPTSVNRTASFSYIGLSNGKGLLKINQAWVIGGTAGADDGVGDYIWGLPPGYAVDPDLIDPVDTDTRGQRSWGVATLVTDSQSNGNDNHIVGEVILHPDGVKIYVDDDGNAIDRQFISDSHYSLADTDQEYKFQCEIPVIRTA